MGEHNELAWPDGLGTIEATLNDLSGRLRDYESRHAALLRGPEPCGERAAAFAGKWGVAVEQALQRCDAVAQECDEGLAGAETFAVDWLTRSEAWRDHADSGGGSA